MKFLLLLILFTHIHTQRKRRPRVAYLLTEVFALPIHQNKQQETYADMINLLYETHKQGKSYPNRHLLSLCFYDGYTKVAKFLLTKHKAHINATHDYFHKGKKACFQYVLNPHRGECLRTPFWHFKTPQRRNSYLARKARTIISAAKIQRKFEIRKYFCILHKNRLPILRR